LNENAASDEYLSAFLSNSFGVIIISIYYLLFWAHLELIYIFSNENIV